MECGRTAHLRRVLAAVGWQDVLLLWLSHRVEPSGWPRAAAEQLCGFTARRPVQIKDYWGYRDSVVLKRFASGAIWVLPGAPSCCALHPKAHLLQAVTLLPPETACCHCRAALLMHTSALT